MLIALALFVLVPLLVPAAIRWLGPRAFALVALLPAAVFGYTLVQSPVVVAGGELTETLPWVDQIGLELSVRLDTLSLVLALIVTGVGAIVIFYCWFYFPPTEEGLGAFGANLLGFTGTMYGLVIADNVYLLFVFWEATSVFSYLLIGHHAGRRTSRAAALQALLVTTAGGLAMFVGLVMLAVTSGTTSLAEIVADGPRGPIFTMGILLMLLGALTKSAMVPFHFWLASAMAAPTPVSAFLHAAAMVQAGIYLIARLAPGFATTPGFQTLLVGVGVVTMLVGGWRALKQFDLKLLLAYGTVSQLGLLAILVGYGTRDAALAGLALLIAHAVFKAALFLAVGVIDHRVGTRDLRKLGGLWRQAPVLAVITAAATVSMAGLPFTFGFVAKESAFGSLLPDAAAGSTTAIIALVGVTFGSVLTVAYSARLLWGAFATKPGVESARPAPENGGLLVAPLLLAVAGIALAPFAEPIGTVLAGYSDTLSAGAPPEYHLAFWHGLDPALAYSAVTVLAGLVLFLARDQVFALQSRVPASVDSGEMYWKSLRGLDQLAARTTAATQRGSLPFYLGVILLVLLGSVGAALAAGRTWPEELVAWDYAAQPAIAAVMGIAAIAAARAGRRFQAALLVGATGYGMAALFAFHGAPDLALTQVLVESVTIIAFVLVLRRLPARLGEAHRTGRRMFRAAVGIAFGAMMAAVAVVALGARTALPISLELPGLAVTGGHGINVVNVILVDIRGWDTMGELSVIIVAATGVASLVFLRSRTDDLPRVGAGRRRTIRSRVRPVIEPVVTVVRPDVESPSTRRAWLLAGRRLAPENRSILLEVMVRLLFHSIIVLSVYLLFAGHNSPGGGFAGGLVAGLALVGRYLAGGRYELGAAAPIDAGKVLGAGLLLAVGTATAPLIFGVNALSSSWFEADLPVLGHIEVVSSTVFDAGVYLVVIGLVLDVLRSLGAEVDRQQEMVSDKLSDGSSV